MPSSIFDQLTPCSHAMNVCEMRSTAAMISGVCFSTNSLILVSNGAKSRASTTADLLPEAVERDANAALRFAELLQCCAFVRRSGLYSGRHRQTIARRFATTGGTSRPAGRPRRPAVRSRRARGRSGFWSAAIFAISSGMSSVGWRILPVRVADVDAQVVEPSAATCGEVAAADVDVSQRIVQRLQAASSCRRRCRPRAASRPGIAAAVACVVPMLSAVCDQLVRPVGIAVHQLDHAGDRGGAGDRAHDGHDLRTACGIRCAAALPIHSKPCATLRSPETSTKRETDRDMRSIGARIAVMRRLIASICFVALSTTV